MRTGEMLSLHWDDIDFLNCVLRVEKSKSAAAIRSGPLSGFAKTELLKWRNLVGPEFSEWVFPTFSNRRHPLQGGRKAWASALEKAGIAFFPIYNLRHERCCHKNPDYYDRNKVYPRMLGVELHGRVQHNPKASGNNPFLHA